MTYTKLLSLGTFAALCFTSSTFLHGQVGKTVDVSDPDAAFSTSLRQPDLPDAPEPQGEMYELVSNSYAAGAPARTPRFAPKPLAPLYNKYIEPEQRARPLTGFGRKLYFGVHQIESPYFLLAVVGTAGYEHVLDESPNYGTNSEAFAQRIGAAAARNASQSLFSDGLMPAVFHQDPRYYVRGKSHSTLARATYAASRILIIRTDGGKHVPNYALFTGHAETVLLQNAYYPDVNRNVRENVEDYVYSFGGVALSNVVREFFPDLLHLVHLE